MHKDRIRIGELTCSPHSIANALEEIQHLVEHRDVQPRTLFYLNAHVYVLASRNPELKQILEAARIVVADGMSIVWCSDVKERCSNSMLFRTYHEGVKGTRTCILLGGNNQEMCGAMACLEREGKWKVVAAQDGYQTPEDYRAMLEQHRNVDFVLLGMGTPKSEQIAVMAASICPHAVVWHIGGGLIQFLAGTFVEAPDWMGRVGLQWLFRLCVEPRRMWRRYILGLPIFFWKVLMASLGRKRRQVT